LKQYFDKVFKFVEPPKGSVGFEINCLFHSLTQYDLIGEEGFHNDSSDMAGVVYLNNRTDIDPFRHGTTIIRDGERIHIPYEYNKLILYRGSMRHSASTGFGKDIADSRLTFNMFFNVK